MSLPPSLHRLIDSSAITPRYPPTSIFNEGWLVRLVMDWFSQHPASGHPLHFLSGSTWFSDGLIATPFLPRFRNDPLGEGRAHTSAVFGHIAISRENKVDLVAGTELPQFCVIDARLMNDPNPSQRGFPGFDPSARLVACTAETLRRARIRPEECDSLALFLVAPQERLDRQEFDTAFNLNTIQRKVQRRVKAYEGEKDAFYREWFLPTLERIELELLPWEVVLEEIGAQDPTAGQDIFAFYDACLELNHPSPAMRDSADKGLL